MPCVVQVKIVDFCMCVLAIVNEFFVCVCL